jgi:hypothetical protein
VTRRLTRRTLLRSGTAAGLVAAAGLPTSPAAAAARDSTDGTTGTASGAGAQAAHLVADYRPSQPTGWPRTAGQSFSATIGGHTPSVDFTFNNRPCRVSVIESGVPADPTAPRYEDRPADPDINFVDVLASTSGAHYTFRYLGGFPGRGELRVQSYSAFATQDGPETRFGADLHVVYTPDLAHGDPPADDAMQWIQVVSRRDPMGPATEVDNSRRANPFYIYGGLTSVNGRLLVNFQDTPQNGIQIASGPGPDAPGTADDEPTLGEHLFRAETFLVRDTGQCDRSGRGIVEVYGGIRWGWHAVELS